MKIKKTLHVKHTLIKIMAKEVSGYDVAKTLCEEDGCVEVLDESDSFYSKLGIPYVKVNNFIRANKNVALGSTLLIEKCLSVWSSMNNKAATIQQLCAILKHNNYDSSSKSILKKYNPSDVLVFAGITPNAKHDNAKKDEDINRGKFTNVSEGLVDNEGNKRTIEPTKADVTDNFTVDVSDSEYDAKGNFKVKVKPGKKCFTGENTYTVIGDTKAPKGYALIISISSFDDADLKDMKDSAEKDEAHLKALFLGLGIKWRLKRNIPDEEELKIEINDFKRLLILENAKSCFVVILSHGQMDTIFLKKEQVNVWTNIIDPFKNENFPELQYEMPKIFLFDACRVFQSKGRDDFSDTLVCFACRPGQPAWYENSTGSFFTNTLTRVFMDFAGELHLKELLEMVKIQLKDNQTVDWEDKTFKKKFYFNPGF